MTVRHARTRTAAALTAAMIAATCGWYGSGVPPAGAQAAEADLFDRSFVHDVDVTFDQAEYDAMIATFQETGDKEWIEATVTVDGETFQEVGMRLKGNSSLMGLRTGFPGGPGGSASADQPEGLPWLIRWDEFIGDQEPWGGRQYLNIRSNPSQTSLNEAVAMDLLEEAGLASQQAIATSFSVNGSDEVLRLGMEIPDDDVWQDTWEERLGLECQGALYKAKSGGDWSYRGDDPDAYDDDVFEQKGGKNAADLTPLIDFLRWLNEADDATFAAELPERFDVDALATYLAMMDLLANWDSIDGPGNNAYLMYDTCAERWTLVPWDMNLSLGVGFGGGGLFPPGGISWRTNPLTDGFRANPDFQGLYQQRLTELQASLVDSGRAGEIIDTWVDLLTTEATHLVDEATITAEADAIRAQFTSLGSDEEECVTATNAEHVSAGRAASFLFYVWAEGSDAFLGFTFQTTSLRDAAGIWTPVENC